MAEVEQIPERLEATNSSPVKDRISRYLYKERSFGPSIANGDAHQIYAALAAARISLRHASLCRFNLA
jgi:hypothetical protein